MLQAIILIKLIKSIDCVILIKLIYKIDGASKLICFISSRYLVGVLLIGALLIEHPKLINPNFQIDKPPGGNSRGFICY